MVLNTKEILKRLFDETDSKLLLGVVPLPSRNEVKSGGASIDLHLGRWFRVIKQANISVIKLKEPEERELEFTGEKFVPFDKEFILHPNKFVLASSLEWITMPGDLAAYVTGKSSLARRGLVIETAAGVHPGFAGCITLELANVGEIPISLTPGMKICQLFLHQASSFNARAGSQFKGRRKPGLGTVS
jgi:dCTP deaminase